MEERYLFKAKGLDNEEWVAGHYVKGLDMYDKEVHLIFEPTTIFYSSGETDGWHKVDPFTICQCTGLKDKNGKLIWENDYLKSFDGDGDDWEISKVVFGEDSLGVGWHEIGIKSLSEYNCKLFDVGLSRYDASKREIIGNIFDNKELLESEEK
mgnify:CR=1 FL=1